MKVPWDLQEGGGPQARVSTWLRISEFTQNFRLLADFLSHLGKWVRLIKFEAEYEHFYTREVEKPQNNTFSPSFTMCISQDSLN